MIKKYIIFLLIGYSLGFNAQELKTINAWEGKKEIVYSFQLDNGSILLFERPGMRDLPILIDMVSREIFLGNQNNLVHQDNYLGIIGEKIALQGFESTDEHELTGMIKSKIELKE